MTRMFTKKNWKLQRLDEILKRILDISISVPALFTLSPIFFVIAILEKLTGQNVFFKQERVGRDLKKIKVYKFTTMPLGSEKFGSITTISDSRITKLGKFLRKYKLNELPQIFNVIKGEMSIVGPRPLLPEHAEIYPEEVRAKIYSVKPGITGIGSLYFSKEDIIMDGLKDKEKKERFYRQIIMPKKAELELWYAKNRTLKIDICIIALTLLKMTGINVEKAPQRRNVLGDRLKSFSIVQKFGHGLY